MRMQNVEGGGGAQSREYLFALAYLFNTASEKAENETKSENRTDD